MKGKVVLLAVLAALLLCPVSKGAEGTEYLFRLAPEAAASIEAAELDAYPICEAERVYVTGNHDLVRSLDRQGMLSYYEINGPVLLMEYTQDKKTLAAEDWPRAILGADYAMTQGNGGKGVRIGMIDSGIDDSFKDYTDAVIVPGVNYCAAPAEDGEDAETPEAGNTSLPDTVDVTSPRRDTSDSVGHGTFAASLLVSREAGLCPGAELVPLKCFESKNSGSIDAIAEAIYDAVDVYHCDVLNMSFGVTKDYETLKNAVSYAYEHGVILVSSAGNIRSTSTGNDPVFYPAAYEQVVSVGSLDQNKNVAVHSSQNSSIWVTAPGVDVRGLSARTGSYTTNSGTSFAASYVSAAAALARSAKADLSPSDFLALLAKTAEDLGAEGKDSAYGHGMMNLGLLLAAVTKDRETMIPSYFQDTLCLSLWLPLRENGTTWLACYQADGRFRSLEEFSGREINNLPLSEDAPELLLMSLDRDSFAPLGLPIRYGRSVP